MDGNSSTASLESGYSNSLRIDIFGTGDAGSGSLPETPDPDRYRRRRIRFATGDAGSGLARRIKIGPSPTPQSLVV